MKIIISPAKQMKEFEDNILWETTPAFLEQAKEIRKYLAALTFSELQTLWKCNEKIALQNQERLGISLDTPRLPALLAYEGLQYQYMAAGVFDHDQWDYVKEHLIILSGLYGVLKPTDGIVPYRLEMQAKLPCLLANKKNLYQYWGDTIYKELTKNSDFILNLASKEYSKTIEKYLQTPEEMITCTFGYLVEGKVKTKATEAKMARGEMVRYLATNKVTDREQIKLFTERNHIFSKEYSTKNHYVFLKREEDH